MTLFFRGRVEFVPLETDDYWCGRHFRLLKNARHEYCQRKLELWLEAIALLGEEIFFIMGWLGSGVVTPVFLGVAMFMVITRVRVHIAAKAYQKLYQSLDKRLRRIYRSANLT